MTSALYSSWNCLFLISWIPLQQPELGAKDTFAKNMVGRRRVPRTTFVSKVTHMQQPSIFGQFTFLFVSPPPSYSVKILLVQQHKQYIPCTHVSGCLFLSVINNHLLTISALLGRKQGRRPTNHNHTQHSTTAQYLNSQSGQHFFLWEMSGERQDLSHGCPALEIQ